MTSHCRFVRVDDLFEPIDNGIENRVMQKFLSTSIILYHEQITPSITG